MGAKIIPILLSTLLLCGCTYEAAVPYVQLADNVYATEEVVWEEGNVRDRQVTDKQVLQYVTDDNGIDLQPGELAFYYGTLYSLSNYRAQLLSEGYTIESETQTPDVLDTVLSKEGERVRLIYQRSGTIRIIHN